MQSPHAAAYTPGLLPAHCLDRVGVVISIAFGIWQNVDIGVCQFRQASAIEEAPAGSAILHKVEGVTAKRCQSGVSCFKVFAYSGYPVERVWPAPGNASMVTRVAFIVVIMGAIRPMGFFPFARGPRNSPFVDTVFSFAQPFIYLCRHCLAA